MNLVVGCGYVGHRVAAAWLAAGREVAALTRSTARANTLSGEGISPIVGDVLQPDTLLLPPARTVLFALGYDRGSSSATQYETYVNGLENVLAALPDAQRIIYISSTGVYGQTNDEWVDEESVCEPTREGGQACLAAEGLLGKSTWGGRSVILRLAGIYGPGRVPNVKDAQARLGLNVSGFLNLVHVEDAVRVVLAAERYDSPPATFLVSDGTPVLRQDYYREIADRFPQTTEPPRSATATRKRMGSKRISNQRMLRELGVELSFPTYREGLAAIAAGC